MAGNLFVVTGPSGAGKGTLINAHREVRDTALIVSCTTRLPRSNEVNGEHYHFITKEEFDRRVGDGYFLEYAEYNGRCYGTPRQDVEDALKSGLDVVVEIECQGAQKIRNIYKWATLIFCLPPSMDELEKRLRSRGTETEEDIQGRLAVARAECAQLLKCDLFNYVIVTDDLEREVQELEAIRTAVRVSVKRRLFDVDLNWLMELEVHA